MNRPHDPPRKDFSTEEVRQAVPVHRMRYVLAFGIAGVVCGFIVVGYIAARLFW